MIKLSLTLALAVVVLLGQVPLAAAQDDHRSILRELRSVPASAYDVGVLKVERLMTGLDDALWSYTYDLSDYGEDDDGYTQKYHTINYRYGYAQYIRENDTLLLIGVALANGTYLETDYCLKVLDKLVDTLLNETGSRGSRRDRAGAFLEQIFPYSEPWTDEDQSDITELLLSSVLVEVRLFERLPQLEPNLTCRGHLYDSQEEFAISALEQ